MRKTGCYRAVGTGTLSCFENRDPKETSGGSLKGSARSSGLNPIPISDHAVSQELALKDSQLSAIVCTSRPVCVGKLFGFSMWVRLQSCT